MQFLPKYQVLRENKFYYSLPLKSKATVLNSNSYSDEKCCLSSLHKMIATSHVWLLSTWNVTSVTEQLNFNLILISHIRSMAIIMEKHKIKKNLPSSKFFFFGCAGSSFSCFSDASGSYSLLWCRGFSLQCLQTSWRLLQSASSRYVGSVVVCTGLSCS